jgi:alpha-glucosidase
MDDFDELLSNAHTKGIKIILDMVINHTSDQHPWFLESKSNRINLKHDWYIWREGKGKKGRKPPNNWHSLIGGSAWEWNEERKQFYLHQFLPCQPDLNWWNPEVQEVMFDILRFWLDKDVDGFRLDIIHTLFEDNNFRNNPRSWRILPSPTSQAYLFQSPRYTQCLPETIKVCKDIRELLNSYSPERVLIGEISPAGGPKIILPFYGEIKGGKNTGLHLVFNLKIRETFKANKFYNTISESEKILHEPYWPCYVFSSHDVPRMISHYGDNEEKARLLTLLMLTLRGTPIVYYGEEIGMRQVKIPKVAQKDPLAQLRIWGIPVGKFTGRDGCRTPMQWNSNPLNAGFSEDQTTKPWLPIFSNSSDINVKTQLNRKNSMLTFYKQLIKLRRQKPALMEGSLELIPSPNRNCLIYKRKKDSDFLIVLLNFNKKMIGVTAPKLHLKPFFSTYYPNTPSGSQQLTKLRAYEGIILTPK